MIKKYFKIFKIVKEFKGTYSTDHYFESVFAGVDQNDTKEKCEHVIEGMGVSGVQYAIVEVWEKETE